MGKWFMINGHSPCFIIHVGGQWTMMDIVLISHAKPVTLLTAHAMEKGVTSQHMERGKGT